MMDAMKWMAKNALDAVRISPTFPLRHVSALFNRKYHSAKIKRVARIYFRPKSSDAETFIQVGKVGRDVTLDEAKLHARNVGLQLLAALRDEIGSLDKVVRFGRVFGMVNAVPDFADHPKVINGCSDLFVEVWRSRSARSLRRGDGLPSLQHDG
jgi:hypothetical protein